MVSAVGITGEIARNTARMVTPFQRRRDRQALELGYDCAKDNAAYPTTVFKMHAAQIRQARQTSGNVLEIGPGGNVGVALLFLAAGASSATCIDVLPWNRMDLPLYSQLVDDPDSYFDRIEYRVPEAIETTRLPDASFDIVYSQAVLEHVADPAVAIRQIARLLRPGGVTSHQIDLRDHRDFDRPLNFLRYPDWIWRAATSRRAYTNRWRRSAWIEALEREGLTVLAAESTETYPVDQIDRNVFHHRFRRNTVEDLACLGLLISAMKPALSSG